MYIKEKIISSIIFMHPLYYSRCLTLNTLETCGSYIFYFVADCSVPVSLTFSVSCLRENLIAGCGVKQAMNFKFQRCLGFNYYLPRKLFWKFLKV